LQRNIVATLLSAFKILEGLHKKKGDFSEDFPDAESELNSCRKILLRENTLTEDLLVEIQKILKFNRAYSVVELADKINDVDHWFEESMRAASAFYKYWGLNKDLVSSITKRYRLKLLEGFLELAFRKGRGLTEVDAIRSFRYNMGGRLPEEYFVNLVRGWISEDLAKLWIEQNIKSRNVCLEPLAHDADRKIRFKSSRRGKGRIISGEADFLVKRQGSIKEAYLETQRVDLGRLRETNAKGERPVNIPGHRPEIERKALKEHKDLVLFLFNEGTESKPPEIAIVVNPWKNKKVKKREGNTFVWVKFIPVNVPLSVSALRKTLQ